MQNTPIILSAIVSVVAVVAAAVSLVLGHITAGDFLALVGPITGAAVGVGAHAAGVSSQSS
jgi:hypothetical protein